MTSPMIERVALIFASARGCDDPGSGKTVSGQFPCPFCHWDESAQDESGCMYWAEAAIKAMPSWQPIETAPKDGTMILAINANYAYGTQKYQIVGWAGVISDTAQPGFSNVGWHNQSSDDEMDAPNT